MNAEPGQRCLAQWCDGQWYCATVRRAEEGGCVVCFDGYGDEEYFREWQHLDLQQQQHDTASTATHQEAEGEPSLSADRSSCYSSEGRRSTATPELHLIQEEGDGEQQQQEEEEEAPQLPDDVQREMNQELMAAAREGREDDVEKLLSLGADKDTSDERGVTPLMLAVSQRHQRVATVLLDGGADVEKRSKQGNSVLDVALMAGDEFLIEEIQKRQAKDVLHSVSKQCDGQRAVADSKVVFDDPQVQAEWNSMLSRQKQPKKGKSGEQDRFRTGNGMEQCSPRAAGKASKEKKPKSKSKGLSRLLSKMKIGKR